ncbi:hypothetical protein MKEN_01052800 [Mycena kentingensis (nom. inval.)]|nr:hypothetical protein MKEN_01052800 [Mycena kentingensis (nom. inval.)]
MLNDGRQQQQQHNQQPAPPTPMLDHLDSLDEIPLKGFPEMAASPSSATMTLPTPEIEQLALPDSSDMPMSYFKTFSDDLVVPGAPHLKDLDSFSLGSKEGSFASLPAAEVNELGYPVYPISAPALAVLSEPRDAMHAIEQWRYDVHDSHTPQPVAGLVDVGALPTAAMLSPTSDAGATPTTYKRPRPRSSTSEDDDDARRNRRARAGTPPSPSLRARAQSFGTSGSSGVHHSFLWVDVGPPPNVFPWRRPPSRANSAPPD